MSDYISKVIDEVITDFIGNTDLSKKKMVVAGVSNRHLHLSKEHVDILFGKGYQLTPLRMLKQPGQYAAEETLTLVTRQGSVLKNVRIIGPVRGNTQIELLLSDCISHNIDAPVRISGDIKGTPGITIVGQEGSVTITEGVIIAGRHLHLSPDEAAELGLTDRQVVRLKVPGDRGVVFDNVVIRAGAAHKMEFHIDVDEANACGIKSEDLAEVLI